MSQMISQTISILTQLIIIRSTVNYTVYIYILGDLHPLRDNSGLGMYDLFQNDCVCLWQVN